MVVTVQQQQLQVFLEVVEAVQELQVLMVDLQEPDQVESEVILRILS